MADTSLVADRRAALTVFNLFVQTARIVEKDADTRMHRAAGISTSQFIALVALVAAGGTMTSSRLAEATGTRPHNITLLVDRMERDGMVKTQRKPADRRFVYVKITESGRGLLAKATPAANEVVARTMAPIKKRDLAVLERLLRLIRDNVEPKGAAEDPAS